MEQVCQDLDTYSRHLEHLEFCSRLNLLELPSTSREVGKIFFRCQSAAGHETENFPLLRRLKYFPIYFIQIMQFLYRGVTQLICISAQILGRILGIIAESSFDRIPVTNFLGCRANALHKIENEERSSNYGGLLDSSVKQ